jgi:hypothetical protein
MCDSTGGMGAAVAICHGCGVALCREHLDEDLLSYKPQGLARRSCNHDLHGAAMARREARVARLARPSAEVSW